MVFDGKLRKETNILSFDYMERSYKVKRVLTSDGQSESQFVATKQNCHKNGAKNPPKKLQPITSKKFIRNHCINVLILK